MLPMNLKTVSNKHISTSSKPEAHIYALQRFLNNEKKRWIKARQG
jgi:hypothetical protein